MSQKEQILAALEAGESFTPMEALERFGSYQIAARIWELRQEGHHIIRDMVDTDTGKKVARYRMGTLPLPSCGQRSVAQPA